MNPAHRLLTKVQDLTPIHGLEAVHLLHRILVSSLSFILFSVLQSLFSKLSSAHLQHVIEYLWLGLIAMLHSGTSQGCSI